MSYKIITIARQFGSGGHEVGERLSKRLRIPLYDRSLVEMAARELELSPISVEKVDESALHSFLRTLPCTRRPQGRGPVRPAFNGQYLPGPDRPD